MIRWTVLMPTWCNAAVFRTLTPASNERRTAAVTPRVTGGRPSRFPCARARASPARVRSRIIAASNSAKTPNNWKRARPDGVEVSSRPLMQKQIDSSGLELAQKGDEIL